LLNIIKDFAGMTFLPRTTKTLLGSIRGKLNFKELPPGRYYHSGVEAGLLKVMLALKWASQFQMLFKLYSMWMEVIHPKVDTANSGQFCVELFVIISYFDFFSLF
jgi:hypothetical protein